jgi:di/tricarboxylate transporter
LGGSGLAIGGQRSKRKSEVQRSADIFTLAMLVFLLPVHQKAARTNLFSLFGRHLQQVLDIGLS